MERTPEAVIIGHDHYNTLNIIRDLGRRHITFDVILVSDSSYCFTSKSKYVSPGHICFTKIENLVKLLITKYSNSEYKPTVITNSDDVALLLDQNYNKLSSFFNLSSALSIENGILKLMDKAYMTSMANSVGFHTPRSVVLSRKDLRNHDYKGISFPCILKAKISAYGSKDYIQICDSREHLAESIENMDPDTLDNIIIQDYIPSDKIVLVAGCRTVSGNTYVNGTVIKTKTGKKLSNLGLCSIGYLSPSTVEEEHILEFLNKTNYIGLFSFEFVHYNNTYYFIEVNFRADGLLYFYSAAGINFPSIWVDSFYYKNIPNLPSISKKIIGMHEFQYLKNYAKASSLLTNIRDFLSTDVFSIFSFSDIKPFIYKLKYHSHNND